MNRTNRLAAIVRTSRNHAFSGTQLKRRFRSYEVSRAGRDRLHELRNDHVLNTARCPQGSMYALNRSC